MYDALLFEIFTLIPSRYDKPASWLGCSSSSHSAIEERKLVFLAGLMCINAFSRGGRYLRLKFNSFIYSQDNNRGVKISMETF